MRPHVKIQKHNEARDGSPTQIWFCPSCKTTYSYDAEFQCYIPREEVEDESTDHIVMFKHRLCGSPLVLYNRG